MKRRSPACVALYGAVLLSAIAVARAQTPDASSADDPRSAYAQALLNYKSAKFPAALMFIEQAEKELPGDVPVELLKARILTEQGDFAGARKVLNNVYAQPNLTPAYGQSLTLACGDLSLRQHKFDDATKFYTTYLQAQPADTDAMLKLVYARLGLGDLVTAGRYASQLKPIGDSTPAYYFAQAALAHVSGDGREEQDIEQSRTIYGITMTNRYLKTFLEVFSDKKKASTAASVPAGAASGASGDIPQGESTGVR